MSQYQDPPEITLYSASGSCPAYRVVAPHTSDQTGQVCVTDTSVILGISMNDCSATNQAWRVRVAGTAKATCGASVSSGAILTFQTDTGKVVEGTKSYDTTTTGLLRIVGVAIEKGSTNNVIEILVMPQNQIKLAYA